MAKEKTVDPFLARAKSLTQVPQEMSHCWSMVKRGIGAGVFQASDLNELIRDISQQKDCIYEVLAFELIDGRLRISLLDDQDFCDPVLFLSFLRKLKSSD